MSRYFIIMYSFDTIGPPPKIHGNWGDWRNEGPCSHTCGGGSQLLHRDCNNPPPQHGGNACSGSNSMKVACNTKPCPSAFMHYGCYFLHTVPDHVICNFAVYSVVRHNWVISSVLSAKYSYHFASLQYIPSVFKRKYFWLII